MIHDCTIVQRNILVCTAVDKAPLDPDCRDALLRMTGELPERGYARGKRVCNDGFLARAHGTWHEPRRPSMMRHHLQRVEGLHVGGPKLLPVANWHNDGYRATPIARPEGSSSYVRVASSVC